MKPKALNCHKFSLLTQVRTASLLFHTVSVSTFLVLAVSQASTAQVNHGSQQSSDSQLEKLLPVPQSPVPSRQQKPGLKKAPPPPSNAPASGATSVDRDAAVAFKAKPFSNGVQQTPADDIKQMENGLIQQQMTGKAPQAAPKLVPANPANFVAEIQGQTNVPVVNSGANTGQVNAQSPPLLPLTSTTPTQEFTAPTASTFNQLLNNQTPSVPLPPLPGSASNFNQSLNSSTTSPQVSNSSAPTFHQLLNSQVASPQVPSSSTSTFNQQQNSPIATPSVANTPLQTQTFNILLSCQVVTTPSAVGTSVPPGSQLLNCQAVSPQSFTVPSSSFNPAPNPQSGIQPPSVAPTTQQTQTQEYPAPSVPSAPQPGVSPIVPPRTEQLRPPLNSSALREPALKFQGVYISVGDDTAARARLTGIYPVSPQVLFGATLDLLDGDNLLVDSRGDGLNINELYVATSFAGLPNLRFVLGQIDLTSYFDRNSFAKDGASQFFNPLFQTNPALSATGIASRPGFLVNWSVTDNIEAKAAVFSSSDKISDFSLDGFAGEVAIRYGNAIIRGTYATNRDAGIRDSFPESFGIARNQERTLFGPQEEDREEAYGVNAEVYIPNWKMGIFGRYGRYENRDLGEGADTYSFGLSFLDVFTPDDRIGLAYGRGLSNESLRRGDRPDVLELFYDFRFLPNLWLGFSFQERDNFEEAVFGVRVRSEFDILTPRRRDAR
jgi:hypothetical protein